MSLESLIKWLSGLMIIALIGYGGYFSFHIFFWDEVYEEIPIESKTITVINADTGVENEIVYNKREITKGNPFVILLLGVDTENISYGRSDTIALAVVEPEKQKISLLSIPRDTYFTNSHTGKLDKITHAYNNGVTNTINSIESYFNVPIDYYLTINMQGFIEAIDTIGGLQVNVEKDLSFFDRITNSTFSLNSGLQKLDGLQTLNYTRYRGDAEGDFGRNRRQRQVITELLKQTTNFQNASNAKQLLAILEANLRTNIKPIEIGYLLKQIGVGSDLTIEEISINANTARRYGLSVVLIEEAERERVTNEMHIKLKLTQGSQ